MFAPARLWTSRTPARSRIAAIIAAVVVLPFVAETTTDPCGSRAESSEIARGSSRISTLPGRLVPPRPEWRLRPPTVRAAAILALISRLMPGAITWTAAGSARTVTGQLGDRVAVGVHGERPVGADRGLGRALHRHLRLVDVRALEHLRHQREQEPPLGHVGERHDLEQAVVELRVRGRVHPAAVRLAVRRADAVAGDHVTAAAVERQLESGRPPRRECADRAVRVHQVAAHEPRLVGDPVGLRVKPAARDPDERPPVDLAEVDRADDARREHVDRGDRVGRDPEHAGEVVAAAAGEDPEHAVRVPQRARPPRRPARRRRTPRRSARRRRPRAPARPRARGSGSARRGARPRARPQRLGDRGRERGRHVRRRPTG